MLSPNRLGRIMRLLMPGLWLVVLGGWVLPPASQLLKAELAQALIPIAWQKTLATGQPQKPWPWADTWPVAKLTMPNGTDQYVLADANGASLAFGPSLLAPSAPTGQTGTVALAAHRDTHFAALEQSQLGDVFTLHRNDGTTQRYKVVDLDVVDSSQQQLYFQDGYDELKLITCYPFNALAAGGPLRYVVTALPV